MTHRSLCSQAESRSKDLVLPDTQNESTCVSPVHKESTVDMFSYYTIHPQINGMSDTIHFYLLLFDVSY
jgi:hypothetical protein